MVTSTLFGLLAPLLYGGLVISPVERDTREVARFVLVGDISIYWGGICGLLAGILWCWKMYSRTGGGSGPDLYRYGTRLGAGAGAAATVLVHAGLMLAAKAVAIDALVIGLVFGIPAGLILGMIGSATWRSIMNRSAMIRGTQS